MMCEAKPVSVEDYRAGFGGEVEQALALAENKVL